MAKHIEFESRQGFLGTLCTRTILNIVHRIYWHRSGIWTSFKPGGDSEGWRAKCWRVCSAACSSACHTGQSLIPYPTQYKNSFINRCLFKFRWLLDFIFSLFSSFHVLLCFTFSLKIHFFSFIVTVCKCHTALNGYLTWLDCHIHLRPFIRDA